MHASNVVTALVSTKFEVDTTIRCLVSVIAADTLRDLVTLTFDLLTLVSGHTWRVTWSTPPSSLKILRLSVLEGRSLGGNISGGRGRPPTVSSITPSPVNDILWEMSELITQEQIAVRSSKCVDGCSFMKSLLN